MAKIGKRSKVAREAFVGKELISVEDAVKLIKSAGHQAWAIGEIGKGSGITAIYALLQQALTQKISQIDLIYFSRDEAFHAELLQLAEQYPQLQYHYFNTVAQQQHLTLQLLERTVADFGQRLSYACGAAGMMQSINQIYQQLGIAQQ